MSSVGLLERDAELGRIDELLHAAGGGNGGLLVIPGPAGIGKTSLLEACAERASTRGMRVLRVRGDELVMESSFAAVRELLWQEMQKALAGGDDGDLETRDWSLERGTPRSCHDRGSTRMS